MPDAQGREEPYTWLAWLGEKDAHVLLLSLMQAIEGGNPTEATLRGMVAGWRRECPAGTPSLTTSGQRRSMHTSRFGSMHG